MSKTVLIVSYNPELLLPQKQALTEAGYEVRGCASLSAALGAVGPGKIDLMVLSPDIPAGDRRRMEAEAKRRNQNIRIVLFCMTPFQFVSLDTLTKWKHALQIHLHIGASVA